MITYTPAAAERFDEFNSCRSDPILTIFDVMERVAAEQVGRVRRIEVPRRVLSVLKLHPAVLERLQADQRQPRLRFKLWGVLLEWWGRPRKFPDRLERLLDLPQGALVVTDSRENAVTLIDREPVARIEGCLDLTDTARYGADDRDL